LSADQKFVEIFMLNKILVFKNKIK